MCGQFYIKRVPRFDFTEDHVQISEGRTEWFIPRRLFRLALLEAQRGQDESDRRKAPVIPIKRGKKPGGDHSATS